MTIHLDRPDWQQQAACHGMTALFFPGRGEDVSVGDDGRAVIGVAA